MTPRSTTLAALGATGLSVAMPSAAAPAAHAQSATQAAPTITVSDRRLNVRAGRRVVVRGTAQPNFRVSLRIQRAGRWRTLARARTDARGAFTLRDRMRRPLSARARLSAAGAAPRSLGRLNVYRSALASWYGPGLYGQRLGCGGTLSAGDLGVAHRSLPCGARVTLRHRGRTLRVRVIDRGPYTGGREYDLTAATARRLGFNGHGAILTTR